MADQEDDPKIRLVEYSFGSVVKKGMIVVRLTYFEDIHVEMMYPYAKHSEMILLAKHMDEILQGAKVHYETMLGAQDIDKDLEALFGEDKADDE